MKYNKRYRENICTVVETGPIEYFHVCWELNASRRPRSEVELAMPL